MSPPVLYSLKSAGVTGGEIAVLTFARPRRLNAWSPDVIETMQRCLKRAAADPSVRAAILTGQGRYYSAGVDFGGSLGGLMLPSTMIAAAEKRNEALFETFIGFPKPLFAACNGSAVGAAATSALSLCDAVISVRSATFLTPFKKLGITPEGCSSFTFPRTSKEAAKALLEEGRKVTANECLDWGLVHLVVEDDCNVVDHALTFAREWLAVGRGRKNAEEGQVDVQTLRRVNKEESKVLAARFMQKPFLKAQYDFALSKKKSAAAWVFYLALLAQPLISRL